MTSSTNRFVRMRLIGWPLAACAAMTAMLGVVGPATADSTGSAPPCGYEATVIRAFDSATKLSGINAHGWVCGTWSNVATGRGFYWRPEFGDNVFTIPLPAGFLGSTAKDINDNGIVIGEMSGPGLQPHGYVYDAISNTMLGVLEPVVHEGTARVWVRSVNNAGTVVGHRSVGPSAVPYAAFMWTPDGEGGGTYTEFPELEGFLSSATNINDSNEVVGWDGASFSDSSGFHLVNGTFTFLEPIPEGDSSPANAITANGVIAGNGQKWEDGSFVSQRGFLWEDSTFTALLDPLPDFPIAVAVDTWDGQLVIGSSAIVQPLERRATIWHEGQPIELLTMLVGDHDVTALQEARAISSAGVIVVNGSIWPNAAAGVVLYPVDRPLGDLTGDCEVGSDDLALLLSEWGKRDSPADLNRDGTVNGADLAILLANWTNEKSS